MKNILAFLLLYVSSIGFAQIAFKLEGNELIPPSGIVFETGSEKIREDESKACLEHVKAFLDAKSYISLLRIECHTDNSGNEQKNQVLSELRAKSVYDWLTKNGVDCKRLIAVGFGSSKPVADNSTMEGKAANRRVSFINAELRNRPIGGMPVDGGGKISASCR